MNKRSLIAIAALAIPFAGTASANAASSSLVANKPHKQLSVKAAARNRARLARTHDFPAFPRLRLSKRDLDALQTTTRKPAPGAAAFPVGQDTERMFGTDHDYATKRDKVLGEIENFYAYNVPRWGRTYSTPALYEMQHGAALPGCGAAVYNGTYCSSPYPVIGWSMTWTSNAIAAHGDMEWATLVAHEFGHAAQVQLGFSGGKFVYTNYTEAFADCMAGAFMWWAHYYGMTDSVGRGDGYEFRDFYADLADNVTTLDNHGTFQWRYADGLYGWNNGFDGCAAWGRSISG